MKEIFHTDFYHRGCSRIDSGDFKLCGLSSDHKRLTVLHKVAAGDEGFIIFEAKDEIMLLYYRYAIYLKAKDGKLIEAVFTKESVEKW